MHGNGTGQSQVFTERETVMALLTDKIAALDWLRKNEAECRLISSNEASRRFYADTGITVPVSSLREIAKAAGLELFTVAARASKTSTVMRRPNHWHDVVAILAHELRDINTELGRTSLRSEALKLLVHRYHGEALKTVGNGAAKTE